MLPCEVTCVGSSDRERLVTSLWDTLGPQVTQEQWGRGVQARLISSASLLIPAQHSKCGPASKMLGRRPVRLGVDTDKPSC